MTIKRTITQPRTLFSRERNTVIISGVEPGDAKELTETLKDSGLYLPRPTEKKVRAYFKRLSQYHLQYVFIKDHPQEERTVELKNWLNAKEQIPDALKALEDDLRTVLGFTD